MKRSLTRVLLWGVPALGAVQACSSPPGDTGGGGGTAGGGGSSTTSTTGTTTPTTTSSGTATNLPDVFTVTGLVTDGTAPLEGAIVMQAGGIPAFTTGPDGAFSIEITQAIPA